jgi:acyl carrier protein
VIDTEKLEVHNRVIAIIADKLKVDKSTILETSTLHDLGADSLDLVDIIMKLEDQFDIQIDDAQAEKLKNVQDLISYVYQLKKTA